MQITYILFTYSYKLYYFTEFSQCADNVFIKFVGFSSLCIYCEFIFYYKISESEGHYTLHCINKV